MITAVWNIVHLHPTATPFPVVMEFEPPAVVVPVPHNNKGMSTCTETASDNSNNVPKLNRCAVNTLPAKRRKLEFVHITKTGGSSMEFAASRAGINWGVCHYARMKSLGCTSPDLDPGYQASPWHVPPKYLTSSPSRQNPYVQADLFTVIRNPYSRFVSEFHCPWTGIQSSGGHMRTAMFGNITTTALSTVPKADYIFNPNIMNVWIQWKVTQIHTAIQLSLIHI